MKYILLLSFLLALLPSQNIAEQGWDVTQDFVTTIEQSPSLPPSEAKKMGADGEDTLASHNDHLVVTPNLQQNPPHFYSFQSQKTTTPYSIRAPPAAFLI